MQQRFRVIGMWTVTLLSAGVIATYVVGLLAVGLWDVSTYGLTGTGPTLLAQAARPMAVIYSVLFDRRVRRFAWQVLLVGGCTALFGYLSRHKNPDSPQLASGYGSHGSSRWATEGEVRRAFAGSGPGAVLGRLSDDVPVIFPWSSKNRNRFVLLIGPPGSGKTSRYTLPNLLHAAACDRRRSIIATDPKGDLCRDTAELMRKAGFRVLVLNLIDFEASLRYNPMDYVHSPEDAQRLAATIISNTEGPHSGG
ncbi:MAG TPA: type IV secretory system conjugative DNA transfer family protein, partial [Symbiobacteriaceae bacterium]